MLLDAPRRDDELQPASQPRAAAAHRFRGLLGLRVREEGGRRRPASWLDPRDRRFDVGALLAGDDAVEKVSRLPFGPGNPEERGLGRRGRSRGGRGDERNASRRSPAARTTPPLPTRSRPSSNCGLTIARTSPPGARTPIAGSTFASEMNETSIVARSGATAARPAVSSRALKPSMTLTRSSLRSPQSSWPGPTSSAITGGAPRGSSSR